MKLLISDHPTVVVFVSSYLYTKIIYKRHRQTPSTVKAGYENTVFNTDDVLITGIHCIYMYI